MVYFPCHTDSQQFLLFASWGYWAFVLPFLESKTLDPKLCFEVLDSGLSISPTGRFRGVRNFL